jgi:hypothetical protein
MKLRARIDILAGNEKIKAGAPFDMDEATGLTLIRLGWAEPAPEDHPEEKPAKKTTKKKA